MRRVIDAVHARTSRRRVIVDSTPHTHKHRKQQHTQHTTRTTLPIHKSQSHSRGHGSAGDVNRTASFNARHDKVVNHAPPATRSPPCFKVRTTLHALASQCSGPVHLITGFAEATGLFLKLGSHTTQHRSKTPSAT
jgi:hypothetical protein